MQDNSEKLFVLACFVSVVVVLGVFGCAYSFYGHGMLPIGWDTPHYAGQVSTILKNGVFSFIEQNDYYDFVYGVFLSSFGILGISPLLLEIFVPIILCVSIAVLVGVIARKFLGDMDTTIYAVLLAACWFALYRLGADLHPNLLALTLFLAGFALFFPAVGPGLEGQTMVRARYCFFALLILISFVHVETGVFFAFTLLVSISLFRISVPSKYPLKRMLIDISMVVFAILPSLILYFRHLELSVLSYGVGILASYPTLSFDQWIGYLGIIVPFSILGLCLTFRDATKKRDRTSLAQAYSVLFSAWGLSSLGLAFVQYVYPSFFIYSERALTLFPTPFVASIGMKAILGSLRIPKLNLSTSLNRRNVAVGALALAILSSSLVSTSYEMMPHTHTMSVWISGPAYERLAWLSEHYKLDEPIFIYNDYDEYAGGMAAMYDNWVQVVYGEHCSYLGRLDLLLSLAETPFTSPTSQTISATFLREMQKKDVFTTEEIVQHKIVVISDFYLPDPLPTYDRELFDEVTLGVFVLNSTRFKESGTVFIPLYADAKRKAGSWYTMERNWTESRYALELWDPTPPNQSHCEVPISIPTSGNYNFTLRYLDGAASDIEIRLNDDLLGRVQYKGSKEARDFTVSHFVSSAGLQTITIVLDYTQGLPQYASLDYLSISPG